MPSVYVKTLGCKVNTFDANALSNQFLSQGFDLLSTPEAADVTVVNTCSVTANADKEARYLARRLRRESPDTLLVFTGCYAQTDSAVLVAMDEIDCVVPNEAKDRLVPMVQKSLAYKKSGQASPDGKMPLGSREVRGNRQSHFKSALTFFDRSSSAQQTRAFLKVQDGCDSFCTYCLIPYARGSSRSVEPDLVLAEVNRLAAMGCLEIVLTGIHIGDYGRDLPTFTGISHPIVPLLEQIFAALPNGRVRISSLEPSEVTPALIDLLARHAGQVCDHFHLPLQSGSDRILKQMRRSYDTKAYTDAVTLIRDAFPEASLGADVIPGFPSESDDDFALTQDLIKNLGLSYLHVFPYSKRPNTAAFRMQHHLPPEVVKQRAAILRALSKKMAADYASTFVGRYMSVIWEKDQDNEGRQIGHAQNYLTVVSPASHNPRPGSMTMTHLKGFVEQGKMLGIPSLL